MCGDVPQVWLLRCVLVGFQNEDLTYAQNFDTKSQSQTGDHEISEKFIKSGFGSWALELEDPNAAKA